MTGQLNSKDRYCCRSLSHSSNAAEERLAMAPTLLSYEVRKAGQVFQRYWNTTRRFGRKTVQNKQSVQDRQQKQSQSAVRGRIRTFAKVITTTAAMPDGRGPELFDWFSRCPQCVRRRRRNVCLNKSNGKSRKRKEKI